MGMNTVSNFDTYNSKVMTVICSHVCQTWVSFWMCNVSICRRIKATVCWRTSPTWSLSEWSCL